MRRPDSEFIKPLDRLRLKWKRLTKDAFRQKVPPDSISSDSELVAQIKRKSKPKQVNQANPDQDRTGTTAAPALTKGGVACVI